MHVVGYRSQSLGAPVSTLSFVRGWTEPSLYGDRLFLGVQLGAEHDPRAPTRNRGNWITAVHPFSYDRDRYYRFSGGDTVVVMRSATRMIRLVRVHVTPRLGDATRLAAFEGEIDLDADRHQIVRMRGQFVILAAKGRPTLSPVPGLVGVVYCEFVNAEIDGRYWLPAFQRTELQSAFALLGQTRAVMRVVSHFSDHVVETSVASALPDVAREPTHRTTWAPSDSVSRFNDWTDALGSATFDVNSNDFDDVAPDIWRQTGKPRLDIAPTKTDNIFRYNRVEGLFTGVEANLRMRSAVPGLTMAARSVGRGRSAHSAAGLMSRCAGSMAHRHPRRAEAGEHQRFHSAAQSGERRTRRHVRIGRRLRLRRPPHRARPAHESSWTIRRRVSHAPARRRLGPRRGVEARARVAGGGTFRPNRGSGDATTRSASSTSSCTRALAVSSCSRVSERSCITRSGVVSSIGSAPR